MPVLLIVWIYVLKKEKKIEAYKKFQNKWEAHQTKFEEPPCLMSLLLYQKGKRVSVNVSL